MSKINFMKTMRVPTSSFNKDNKIGKNQKDAGWNHRFHLDKIPSYNAYQDHNSKIYQIKLRSILKSLNSKPSKKSVSPVKGAANYEDLLKMDNRAITNKFYKEMNRDIEKEISEKVNDPISEEMSIIQSMWDDLGVLESYRVIFRYICLELDHNTKKSFMEFELNSLRKLYEYFSKLTKELQGRERVISLLRQYNNFLENDNISPKLTSDITQTFKNLRILSINIVHIFIQIREISSYSILCGKYDFDKINKNFNYDRNYLIKMRTDTDFLKQSNLSKYFHIANNISDPFLLSLSNEHSNSTMMIVPLTDDMRNSIKKCQLFILQDQLYYEINLSLFNHQNNLDFSERSLPTKNRIQNLKEYPQRKHNEKKVQSATIPLLERQHDEFTIKSKIEAGKIDINNNNFNNNIRVEKRISSAKKQTLEDGIDKSLNDSKIKKNPSQKIEKLDIKIKEKLDLDAKDNRDKEINNIINIEENCNYKYFENKENVETKEDKIEKKESSRKVEIVKKESIKIQENKFSINSEFSNKKLENVRTSQKSQQKIDKEIVKERKSKEISVKDIRDMNSKQIDQVKVDMVEDNIDYEIEDNSNHNKKEKNRVFEKQFSEKKVENFNLNKLNDSNMNEVIDENSIVENNKFVENFNTNIEGKRENKMNDEVSYEIKEPSKVILTKSKEREDFEINDIVDELSFQSEKDCKDEKDNLINNTHSRIPTETKQVSSRRESKKIEQNLEKIILNKTNDLDKQNNEEEIKLEIKSTVNIGNNQESIKKTTFKEKSDSKLSNVMKTEESKKDNSQRDKLSDSKLNLIENVDIKEKRQEYDNILNEKNEDITIVKSQEHKTESNRELNPIEEIPNKDDKRASKQSLGKDILKTNESIKEIKKEDLVKQSSKPQSQEKMIKIDKDNKIPIEGKLGSSKKSLKQINLSKTKSKESNNEGEKENLEEVNIKVPIQEINITVKESIQKIEEIKVLDTENKLENLDEKKPTTDIVENNNIIEELKNENKFEEKQEVNKIENYGGEVTNKENKDDVININNEINEKIVERNDEVKITENNKNIFMIEVNILKPLDNESKFTEHNHEEKNKEIIINESNKQEEQISKENTEEEMKRDDAAAILDQQNVKEDNKVDINGEDKELLNKTEDENIRNNDKNIGPNEENQHILDIIKVANERKDGEEATINVIKIEENNIELKTKEEKVKEDKNVEQAKIEEKQELYITEEKKDDVKEVEKQVEVISENVKISEENKVEEFKKEEQKVELINEEVIIIDDNKIKEVKTIEDPEPKIEDDANIIDQKKVDQLKVEEKRVELPNNENKNSKNNTDNDLLNVQKTVELIKDEEILIVDKQQIVENVNDDGNSEVKITNTKIEEIMSEGNNNLDIKVKESNKEIIEIKENINEEKTDDIKKGGIKVIEEIVLNENKNQEKVQIPTNIQTDGELKEENDIIKDSKTIENQIALQIKENIEIISSENKDFVLNNVVIIDNQVAESFYKEKNNECEIINVETEKNVDNKENKYNNIELPQEVKKINEENTDKITTEFAKNEVNIISSNNQEAPQDIIINSETKGIQDILATTSKIINEKNSDLKINFFTETFEKLQSIYDLYYTLIPQDQLISFKIKKDLKDYMLGNNMKIITIYNQNNLSGLCILNYDSNSNNMVRVYLSHFSTILDNFSEVLLELKNFIFKELMFSEVVVYLYYKKQDEKFEIIPSIRNAFKDLLKFRWVKIENTGGERLLVMSLKNTDESTNYKECPDFNFTLKYNLSYELLQDDGSKPAHLNTEERFLNPLPLIISFANLGVDKGYDVDYEFLKNINNTALHRHYPHFLKVQTEEKNSLTQSIKKYIDNIDYSIYKDNAMITNALVNLAVQFNSVISSTLELEDGRYNYQRINLEKVDIYINDELNIKFYNIPMTDDRHNILIGEISEDFLNSSNENILTDFFLLKSKLICCSRENVNIWIPCFDLKSSKNYNKLHYLNDVKITHNNVNFSGCNFSEFVNISMKEHQEMKTNFKISPDNQNDIIIKNNFLFAVVNIDLATELNLSAIFVECVKKHQWKKEI